MSKSVSMKNEKTSTLYTLIVEPDQTFEVRINGEVATSGSLLEDFTPAVNPATEIDDPKDTKPSTWVDEAKITDSDATKPSDWDEDAPFQIVDETAEKPEDWLEDEPLMVPDPEAEKPEDWDDEEDGDWVAPMVPNPKCSDASGCGPWEKPMIKNPAYKGKWTAPLIDNPLYKGIWAPAKIANPDYFEDKTPSSFEPIGGIGFEIWTMQKDILFDNIYIGHSIRDALQLKAETFDMKLPIEQQEADAAKPKDEPIKPSPNSPMDLSFMDDPVLYIREKVELFITLFQRDPMQAIQFVPEVAGGIGLIVVTLLALLIGGLGAGASTPQAKQAATKVKAAAKDAANSVTKDTQAAKDEAADAIATGAENAKAEANANKRATRSSAN
jgi:calnexin